MSWPAPSMSGSQEFPIVVDRTAYVIPTVGIAAIGSIAGGVIAAAVGMMIATRVPDNDDVEIVALGAWLIATGAAAGGYWVRRTWRIHHERKLIVDARGLTYVAFAGKTREMPWTDILRVEETELYGPDEGYWLVYHLAGRTFLVRDSDFEGYCEIRRLTIAHLPVGRVCLAGGPARRAREP